jgi:hypothetical protein
MVHLAQYNVALARAPLTGPLLAEFVALLAPVDALARSSPGFVWRPTIDDEDTADAVRALGDDRLVLNLSTWESLEALGDFVYGGLHLVVMRRRKEWFERLRAAYAVCWWVADGHFPTIAEAEQRLSVLQRLGPTPDAFTLQRAFSPDAEGTTGDRLCPA